MEQREQRPMREGQLFTRHDERPMERRKRRKPLVSMSHFLVLLGGVMFLGFIFAVLDALGYLPGSAGAGRRLGFSGLRNGVSPLSEGLIWIYLLGAPVLYVLQRFVFWRRTATIGRNLSHCGFGAWVAAVLTIIVSLI